jgi:hypothetical protein
MFDVVAGLPVHALVVHAVVVLLPLMSLVTLAFTVRPKWRPGLPWAIAGNAVALAASFVAKQSGQKLQARLTGDAAEKIAAQHGQRGALLPYFAIALLAVSIAAYLLLRSQSAILTTAAVALVAITGAGTTGWTVLVGHSGSSSVWKAVISSTSSP